MQNSRTSSQPRPSEGFTLFEVVIALAIAALGLTLLMAAAGTGLENAGVADQFVDATRRAQSHLAQIGVGAPLSPGVQSGDDGDGYSWQVRVSPPVLHVAAATQSDQPRLGLYTVEVTVTWHSGASIKSVALQSLRTLRQ